MEALEVLISSPAVGASAQSLASVPPALPTSCRRSWRASANERSPMDARSTSATISADTRTPDRCTARRLPAADLHYWQQRVCPDDDEQLARIVGMSLPEWRNAIDRSCAVLQGQAGDIVGLIARLASALTKYERRANAGKLESQVRWGGRNAIAMGSQSNQSQPQSQDKSLAKGKKLPIKEGSRD